MSEIGFRSYKDESKENYGSDADIFNNEQLQTGALLRIADAAEKMAENYDRLLRDVKYWKERCERSDAARETLRRRVNAYKGILRKKRGVA